MATSDDDYLAELWGHEKKEIAQTPDFFLNSVIESYEKSDFKRKLGMASEVLTERHDWYLAHDADALMRNIDAFMKELKRITR